MWSIPITLLIAHFIGDWLLQSNWMALNKSKNWKALAWHVLVYSLCFMGYGMDFVGITALTHFGTDFITSRITSKLWFINLKDNPYQVIEGKWYPYWAHIDWEKRHWFFVTIGIDQLIHYLTLAATYQWLIGG